MATSILLKFLTLKWEISRTIWLIEVNDGSFSCIFHALSFELNFFRLEFPFNSGLTHTLLYSKAQSIAETYPLNPGLRNVHGDLLDRHAGWWNLHQNQDISSLQLKIY